MVYDLGPAARFVAMLNESAKKSPAHTFERNGVHTLRVAYCYEVGIHFVRIVRVMGTSRSCVAFVDSEGNIFRGKSWRSRAEKPLGQVDAIDVEHRGTGLVFVPRTGVERAIAAAAVESAPAANDAAESNVEPAQVGWLAHLGIEA